MPKLFNKKNRIFDIPLPISYLQIKIGHLLLKLSTANQLLIKLTKLKEIYTFETQFDHYQLDIWKSKKVVVLYELCIGYIYFLTYLLITVNLYVVFLNFYISLLIPLLIRNIIWSMILCVQFCICFLMLIVCITGGVIILCILIVGCCGFGLISPCVCGLSPAGIYLRMMKSMLSAIIVFVNCLFCFHIWTIADILFTIIISIHLVWIDRFVFTISV